jgi:hypothetical protein
VESNPDLFLESVFFALAKGIDTPVSLSCWLLFKHGEFSQLAKKDIQPDNYISADDFFVDYTIIKYLSKYKGLKTGIDTEAVATAAWKAAEEKCKITNENIRSARLRGFSPRVEAVISIASRKIANLLGVLGGPQGPSLASIFKRCKWGPGATFSLKGEHCTLDDKIREFPINVTRRCRHLIQAVIESDPHWFDALTGIMPDGPYSLLQSCFTTVRGCRMSLVEKNAKTKRSIAIEPTANIFLQLAIGSVLRSKLQRVGIDLNDQSRNQFLAKRGSLNGDLATLDLAAASDTVSRELIYELFPVDWAILLDQCRSPEIKAFGSWIKLEKFSSMGNGFTFELESLIFWSLTVASLEAMGQQGDVGIYGDDIILPSPCVPLLTEVLDTLGFSLNMEKSYVAGYFRESCGKHYWNGTDVTPIYQKEEVASEPEYYRAANRLYRCALRSCESLAVDSRFRAAWVVTLAELCRKRHKIDARSLSPAEMIRILSSKRCPVIPLGDESDDGLLLPHKWLHLFAYDWSRNRIKLPVLSFDGMKRKLHDHRSLLSYWLRFGSESSFDGKVPVRRRGVYRVRRRWFSLDHDFSISTVDVA